MASQQFDFEMALSDQMVVQTLSIEFMPRECVKCNIPSNGLAPLPGNLGCMGSALCNVCLQELFPDAPYGISAGQLLGLKDQLLVPPPPPVCHHCDKTPVPGKNMCTECFNQYKARMRENGLFKCRCGADPVPGKNMCRGCFQTYRNRLYVR